MRRLTLILCFVMATPLAAEEHASPEGRDLMGEAMRLFMRGLMAEMEPALDDLSDLLGQIDAYHPPEVLPNGDIIIRRKSPLESDADGEIEL